MPSNEVTSVSEWKRRQHAVKLELPSGKVCLAERQGMRVFLQNGAIPDYLSPLVQEMIREKKHLPPERQKELVNDEDALYATAEMLDRSLLMTVIEPEVHAVPGCAFRDPDSDEQCGRYLSWRSDGIHDHNSENFKHDYRRPTRNDEFLYADDVDEADKIFIMQWSVGGGTDLAEFRDSLKQSMEAVAELQSDGVQAKRPARNR